MEITPYQTYLFPLPEMNLFPGTSIPLNIFEPKYIKMVQDSIKNKTPIAVCPKGLVDKEDYSGVVCGQGMPVILNENEDGTMLILLNCFQKVVLTNQLSKLPYQSYNSMLVNEDEDLNIGNEFKVNRVRIEFSKWIEKNAATNQQRGRFLEKLDSHIDMINYASLFLVHNQDKQYRLLEFNNINDRLELLIETLETQANDSTPINNNIEECEFHPLF
jgi:Lon protease-like protein